MKTILVYLDTLRADHLGCYGYRRATSPRLDALAGEGVLFERAYPTDVPTQPSYTAVLTGQRGIRNGVVSHHPSEDVSESVPWMPEIMAQHGHVTGAVSTLYFMKRYFARGFHSYMNPVTHERRRIQQITADEINAFALPWLRGNADRDFFMFVHYWDPHGIYKAPEEKYHSMFYEGHDPRDPNNHSLDALNDPLFAFFRGHVNAVGQGVTDAEYVIAQYDGEIRYLDTKFGELLDTLTELGIGDDTLLIVTSDHGESMTEHGLYFDHCSVYEDIVHVPLIIRWPRHLPAGKRVGALVQGVDVTATILDAAGIEQPEVMQGESLLPLARGETEQGRDYVFSNQGLWQAKRMISDGRWKLIKALDNGVWPAPARELYDLEADPGELCDLAEERGDVVAELELRLARWEDAQLRGRTDPLRRIVEAGIPARRMVEGAARRVGVEIPWEEYRNLIDVPFKE
jgi:arylsulfatase